MAINLVRAGHSVLLFDADLPKAKKLAAKTGATAVSSLKDLAQKSSSIITMLPNTPHVEAVYLGNPSSSSRPGSLTNVLPLREETDRETVQGIAQETVRESVQGGGVKTGDGGGGGILDWVRPGSLVIDSSTIGPLASRRINSVARENGITMLDAPVSGGVPAAENATLTFIVGGPEEGMDRARPLLLSMGAQAVYCGEAGAGCIAKMRFIVGGTVCNNLALAISMIGVSEAMSLGSKMGMDPTVLANVLNASTARCWASEAYNPCPGVMEGVPSSKGFQGGFAASLMQKDLHLALQAANESSQSLPMGALAHQLYSLLCNQGSASKDFSVIYELISTGPESGGPSK
eukprot:jgi/Undpi1/453/HiC_scaffold_1.g00449.m1